MNIISLFLLGISTSAAVANDASNNDNSRRLHERFSSIQDFEEYVMTQTTCKSNGSSCSAPYHCCSTFCLIRNQEWVCVDHGEVSEAELADISAEESKDPVGIPFEAYAKTQSANKASDQEKVSYYDDLYYDDLYYDDYFASAAAEKESFAKTQSSNKATGQEKVSYYDDFLYWDDFFYDDYFASSAEAKESFARVKESAKGTEEASTSSTCRASGVNCFTPNAHFCCSGICNRYRSGSSLGQCA